MTPLTLTLTLTSPPPHPHLTLTPPRHGKCGEPTCMAIVKPIITRSPAIFLKEFSLSERQTLYAWKAHLDQQIECRSLCFGFVGLHSADNRVAYDVSQRRDV